MTSIRRSSMTSNLEFEAEPFEGYTEFDELNSFETEVGDWRSAGPSYGPKQRPASNPCSAKCRAERIRCLRRGMAPDECDAWLQRCLVRCGLRQAHGSRNAPGAPRPGRSPVQFSPSSGHQQSYEWETLGLEVNPEAEFEFSRRQPRRRPSRMNGRWSRARRRPSPPRRRYPVGSYPVSSYPAFAPPADRFNILPGAAGTDPSDQAYGDDGAQPDYVDTPPPPDAPSFGADDGADSAPGDADTELFESGWLDPETSEMFDEWLGEVSRSSSEYIRWVQQSLNRIQSLRLDVDGISGPLTRSAVRSFQQRARITVDGIVGPQTEGALIKFGASPPPGSSATPTAPPSYGGGSGFQFVKIPGIENTSQAFRDRVVVIARDLGLDPNYLMAIMSFESSLNPQAVNSSSGATGLIQFMPSTATRLGTSTAALYRMTGEQQLDYVQKYFAPYKGRLKSLEDAYMAVLYPSAIGKGSAHVLFSSPSDAYRMNSVLDVNKDGSITVGEATSFVRKRLPPGYITGNGTGAPSTGGSSGNIDLETVGGITVARVIAGRVRDMLAAAKAAGIVLTGGGYRSPEAQINLRRQNCGTTQYDIYEKPSDQCKPPTARPGSSNHEKGLAIDFSLNGGTKDRAANLADPRFRWLKANAGDPRFRFYNLASEPWHWSVDGR